VQLPRDSKEIWVSARETAGLVLCRSYAARMEGAPREIIRHYETIEEGRRISEGLGQLELLRTQEVLGRHLPKSPSSIVDVGGATGVHAEWLASLGYDVTAEVGDACELPVADGSFDAVLLLGPLYHLTERADRLRAWAEARRAVRPGGLIFGAAISRFASLFDGLARGYLFDPAFREIAERDLRDGQHRNAAEREHWFTTAYFHHPDGLRDEAVEAGVEIVELVGVEGLAGWLPQLHERWASAEGREAILFAARSVESEPSLLGLSGHLIAVTRSAG
jgi:SAM-dependent methyltransferase